ncbi:MAG: hypothetical protein ACLRSD_12340 [Oscillibacter sp.]
MRRKRRRIGATAGALHFAALAVKYDATFKGIECFALPLKGGVFQQEKEKSKMQKKNNKGVIALIIVLVLAAAAHRHLADKQAGDAAGR